MSEPNKRLSLRDELLADRGIEGPIPKMIVILNSMNVAQRKEWVEMLGDDDITSESIARGLGRRGYNIGRIAVQRYRDGNLVHRVV